MQLGVVGNSGAAGSAKLAAVLVTYPHEVCQLPFPSTNPLLTNITAGAEDEATTSPNREWDPQICQPCAEFPIGKSRGGLSGTVWWHDATPDALRSVGYHYLWSVRVRVEPAQL